MLKVDRSIAGCRLSK